MLNQKKIADIIETKQSIPLDNEMEIEDVIVAISGLDKKLNFLAKLKKNRVEKIDEEIEKFEERKKLLKQVIEDTLKKFNYKSLNFPGIGRVIMKNPQSKWTIINEEELLKVLKSELSIIKKELTALLDEWEKTNKVPACVDKEIGNTIVNISYGDQIEEKSEKMEEINENRKDTEVSKENFDGIDF